MKLDMHVGFFAFLTVKKLNTSEYRHYLKLWNEETKTKQENTKDLPKLNQVKMFVTFDKEEKQTRDGKN